MSANLSRVDHSALRTNQAVIIVLLLAAFILNLPILAGFVSLVMLGGAALKRPGFGLLYTGLLKPNGWVKPEILEDNPEPHRFAQGFGGAVLAGAALAFWAASPLLGWGMAWLVISLACLNLFAGFCAGCAMYYWLNRLHVPGFSKAAPAGVFPGLRPRAREL